MIRRRHRATPGSCRARYAESQGPRGIARAAARWMRDIPPAKFEGTTGPRAACDDAKAGNERGRQLRRPSATC
jgi:hypothetical protein